MRDFYATTGSMRLDQADGLRRLFAGARHRTLAVAANPHVAFGGVVLDRLAETLASLGRHVLVVDAATGSPEPHELARLDLTAGIERIGPQLAYLPARGLPRSHVDTRGSAAGFVDALQAACPAADLLLVHADAADLARMFARRPLRPMLVGADHPESIKHAYASAKLLALRGGLLTFDLLLAASPHSPRIDAIAASLAQCADNFLGAVLQDWALVDPAGTPSDPGFDGLVDLLRAQLSEDAIGALPVAPPTRAAARSAHAGRH
jgi:hypothetical protein